eukprot:TRINITY_DN12095_c0_g1_i7.p1 TRINITY_DN12095_c0_g1~~TRINITY_DN12095_c0_g1_i7.p1  ORF type:complete len:613 (+),score=123.11 TRINITY_DN12095_c0_g1_i7:667-2505(+)
MRVTAVGQTLQSAQWIQGAASGSTGIVHAVAQGDVRVEWFGTVHSLSESSFPQESSHAIEELIILEREKGNVWHLGQHGMRGDQCVEIAAIQTSLDVLWEDGSLEKCIPATELMFGSPGPHCILPNDVVSMSGHLEDQQLGSVLKVDCVSRMCSVDWGRDEATSHSVFDLDVLRHLCFRPCDIVMKLPDDESPETRPEYDTEEIHSRLGQVVSVNQRDVLVLWLNGTESVEIPAALHMVIGDFDFEDEQGFVGEGMEHAPTWAEIGTRAVSHYTETHVWVMSSASMLLSSIASGIEWVIRGLGGKQGMRHAPEDDDDDDQVEDSALVEGVSDTEPEEEEAAETPLMTAQAIPEHSQLELESFEVCDTISGHALADPPTVPLDETSWIKAVNREWKILRKGLPSNVYVQACESQLELLRAFIVGPEDTPYAGGLFVFDIKLPADYPASPPNVLFWSFGRHINPNLYDNGKVCLSLLNTWKGRTEQMWTPGKSTLLQVLVSIQSLILVSDPYFNEPGIEAEQGTPEGQSASELYNQSARVLTLQIVVHTVRDPTLGSIPVVRAHFKDHGSALLEECERQSSDHSRSCLLYTSDAADEEDSVDLGGRRIIKKKKS